MGKPFKINNFVKSPGPLRRPFMKVHLQTVLFKKEYICIQKLFYGTISVNLLIQCEFKCINEFIKV